MLVEVPLGPEPQALDLSPSNQLAPYPTHARMRTLTEAAVCMAPPALFSHLEVLVFLREALVGQDLVDGDAFAAHAPQACGDQRMTGNLSCLAGCSV